MLKPKQTGFTIVELLIVIVVVAVLASITVVAYRGIRERAVTAAYTSAVDQWEKILNIEIAISGSLPNTGENPVCAGRSLADFPAQGVFAEGVCVRASSSGTMASFSSAYFNQFQSNISTSGALPLTSISLFGETVSSRGIMIYSASSPFRGYSIQWYPQVVGQCGRGMSYGPYLGFTPGALTGDWCLIEKLY